jgi:hypothetical protein
MDAVYASGAESQSQILPLPTQSTSPDTVEEIAAVAQSAVILDCRGGDEILTLGNAISGHVNIAYSENDVDSFLRRCQELVPNKETPIIVH